MALKRRAGRNDSINIPSPHLHRKKYDAAGLKKEVP
jgi:hypothetical protein